MLCGPVWPGFKLVNNNLFLAQMVMVGAKQVGYLQAAICVDCTREAIERSRNRRPANFNFDRRSASYKRWPRRCDGFCAYSVAFACEQAQRYDRRRPSCKRSAVVSGRKLIPPLVHHEPSAVTPRM